jgi:hypothetical protein
VVAQKARAELGAWTGSEVVFIMNRLRDLLVFFLERALRFRGSGGFLLQARDCRLDSFDMGHAN